MSIGSVVGQIEDFINYLELTYDWNKTPSTGYIPVVLQYKKDLFSWV